MLAHSHLRRTSSGPESSHRCPRQGCRTSHPPSCWGGKTISDVVLLLFLLKGMSYLMYTFNCSIRFYHSTNPILPQNVLGALIVVIISRSCDISSRFCVIRLGGLWRAVIKVIVCAVCRCLCLREEINWKKKVFFRALPELWGGGVYPCPNFLALFLEVHFWSIKRVYFFKNANVLNF